MVSFLGRKNIPPGPFPPKIPHTHYWILSAWHFIVYCEYIVSHRGLDPAGHCMLPPLTLLQLKIFSSLNEKLHKSSSVQASYFLATWLHFCFIFTVMKGVIMAWQTGRQSSLWSLWCMVQCDTFLRGWTYVFLTCVAFMKRFCSTSVFIRICHSLYESSKAGF